MIVETILYFLLLGNVLCSTERTNNYCDPSLCVEYKHIACNNNKEHSPNCGAEVETITFNQTLIDYVLNATNIKRNEAAGGTRNLPKAIRMPLLTWDEELQELATLQTMTCLFVRDSCRNTNRFRFSGQNLYKLTSDDVPKYTLVIDDAIKEWYNEISFVTESDIKSYPQWTPGRVIGHFAQLVGERSNRIGCGLTKWKQNEVYAILFTCNFASGNIPKYPVYRTGKVAGSSCTRRDKKFTNCCDADENINPNLILRNGQY